MKQHLCDSEDTFLPTVFPFREAFGGILSLSLFLSITFSQAGALDGWDLALSTPLVLLLMCRTQSFSLTSWAASSATRNPLVPFPHPTVRLSYLSASLFPLLTVDLGRGASSNRAAAPVPPCVEISSTKQIRLLLLSSALLRFSGHM